MMKALRQVHQPVPVYEDETVSDDGETVLDESRDPLAESSGCLHSDSSEDDDIEDSVAEDMRAFQETFQELDQHYRLINRIGEGTFSTVYKAEDLNYHEFRNDWDYDAQREGKWSSPRHRTRPSHKKPRFVAIKKIYVTSSPHRIFNELELLHNLRDCDTICPLITALRHEDQIIAILPYFQHRDFRDYFRDMSIPEMRVYFSNLFSALAAVHAEGILHRDIKPTNFLYSPKYGKGVLVDFGLAEREGTDWHQCMCAVPKEVRRERLNSSVYAQSLPLPSTGPSYPNQKKDERQSRRANRAGTRGFRAPEVLFKCTQQTTAIDMWSAGVILLTFLTQRFPFFHSADDIDALLELTSLVGRKKMREVAMLHGQIMDTNIPTFTDSGHAWEKIVLWSTGRTDKDSNGRRKSDLSSEELEAVEFMRACLDCIPEKRITAEEALQHPFIMKAGEGAGDEDMVDLVQGSEGY